jgi:hypothetical protein
MSPNELINLFTKYNLIPNDPDALEEALELLEEGEETSLHALELLAEYADENTIDVNQGDCCPEDVIEEFVDNFKGVVDVSNGKVAAKNIKASPKVGVPVKHDQEIQITFDWNSKQYSFSFSKVEPDDFIDGFAKWLFEAFDGDFLFIKDDLAFGYVIPKALIKELEAIGLVNHVS